MPKVVIKELWIDGLHNVSGYLKFSDKVNSIYGANGSAKTLSLCLIDFICNGEQSEISYDHHPRLLNYKFNLLKLVIDVDGKEHNFEITGPFLTHENVNHIANLCGGVVKFAFSAEHRFISKQMIEDFSPKEMYDLGRMLTSFGFNEPYELLHLIGGGGTTLINLFEGMHYANGPVLLDNPSVSLHICIKRKLIDYFEARGQQIIFATHDPEVVQNTNSLSTKTLQFESMKDAQLHIMSEMLEIGK